MSEAASPYLSIITMLVESYVLDAAWSLATGISVITGSPSMLMFAGNDSTIKVYGLLLKLRNPDLTRF